MATTTVNETLIECLERCEEYFDDRADADHDGSRYIANKEMRLMMQVVECLQLLGVQR